MKDVLQLDLILLGKMDAKLNKIIILLLPLKYIKNNFILVLYIFWINIFYIEISFSFNRFKIKLILIIIYILYNKKFILFFILYLLFQIEQGLLF